MAISGSDALKYSAAVTLLLIGGSAANYYFRYLPQAQEEVRQEHQREVAQAEQRARDDKVSRQEENEGRRTRYSLCISTAQIVHDSLWNKNCVGQGQADRSAYQNCLLLPYETEATCKVAHPIRSDKDCSLPLAVAGAIDDQLDKEKAECMAEAKSGLAS
jgi:hypothetical protein